MKDPIKEPLTSIEISKEYLHFAAAHFTLFSATEREHLHGHNFQVALDIQAPVGNDGLTFDYNILKTAVKGMCDALDEQVLMPEHSPYLKIERDADYTYILFGDERIPFLDRDLTLLPVRNITVEELSFYLLNELREQPAINSLDIREITLRCSSGEGQWATARWSSTSGFAHGTLENQP
ncbi:MAG: 6-carboxytetrahydropterin synthase [Pseudomonadota bacterium]